MPSPLGHALAGLTVHVLSARGAAERRSLRRAARLVDGRNHHQAETRSVGAAALAAVVVWAAARLGHWARPEALGAAAGCAWLSHLVLDYLGLDTHPPIGIMALWPFERGFHKAPW